MKWNWQKSDWPNFSYDSSKFLELEKKLVHNSGVLFGVFKHLTDENKELLKIELLTTEALKTSEIEGEYLDRDSIQSSIRRHFGLQTDNRIIKPGEKGISEMMMDLYKSYEEDLCSEKLFEWHKILMKHRTDLEYIGAYRKCSEPMQIVSGKIYDPKIHFEAPPSSMIDKEMSRFIDWFNNSYNEKKLPILIRAGITHLYFESIHPFEDGNGRIGRALSEKVLAQGLGQPTLIALSTTINKNKNKYYDALERANKNNEITDWLTYFSEMVLDSLSYTQKATEFLLSKAKMLDRLYNILNPRQKKLLLRMFEEGHEGFTGGLSAKNYMSITKATQPTATRDLSDLVEKGGLRKTGELKSTRYYLSI